MRTSSIITEIVYLFINLDKMYTLIFERFIHKSIDEFPYYGILLFYERR